MKLSTLITTVSAAATITYAGEPVQMAPAPAPAPVVGDWFIGGTFGQFESENNLANLYNAGPGDDLYRLDDLDFEMYTLHVGRDLGANVLGCDLAAYLEVGYMTGDSQFIRYNSVGEIVDNDALEIDIIPITFNLKAEREFFSGVKGYITAGIGYAFTNTKIGGLDENEGGFYAQASIGLAYDITEQWEIYGGARWLYLSDLDLGYGPTELDDAIAYEIGLRYHF